VSNPDAARLVAYDHTDLRKRPKRIWNWGNIPLPGLLMPALGAALGAAALLYLALSALSVAVPFLGLSMWTAALYFGPPLFLYWAWGKPMGSRLTLSQAIFVWADYTVVQPRRIHGLRRDSEPTDLRWVGIVWTPTDPGWLHACYELTVIARGGRRQAVNASPGPVVR